MEIAVAVLWVYGIWKGWKQISDRSGVSAWLPASALRWLNQPKVANRVIKACIAVALGGVFAVASILALLLSLMSYIAHM
ncbi:hypothetical protein [uncultured Gemmiger sp.]|uniref:hypothetical protein n=1 Tax=uncultured Gemmiger sp. TaxID=1623490 RepID=UPI0025FB609E|nr:hypothetical protein [uncultured Gemmiger sp.]